MKVGRDILGELGDGKRGETPRPSDGKDRRYPWVRQPKEGAEKCEHEERSIYLACCSKKVS